MCNRYGDIRASRAFQLKKVLQRAAYYIYIYEIRLLSASTLSSLLPRAEPQISAAYLYQAES